MVDLVVIALLALLIGAIVWGMDKKHGEYGILVPAAVAVVTAMLIWIITVAAGLGYQPGLTWIPWIVSLAGAAAVSVLASLALSSSRAARDTTRRTAILRS
ncbi:hypothetical protein IV498_08520 [Paenarthrobacter sp. Z7-10]|uniref:hypothetical protein n=1 Tax=Paenarthrobacter sp. Z7-10 TaxID=2787635 RepID=UPI0022A91905|nr:hypothetical protein [Paenarthrobacter sp. Z7-10]MCZ2403224.1 hypothetical protein [Paenarthrobacter sp. Z7-10]